MQSYNYGGVLLGNTSCPANHWAQIWAFLADDLCWASVLSATDAEVSTPAALCAAGDWAGTDVLQRQLCPRMVCGQVHPKEPRVGGGVWCTLPVSV